MIRTMPSWFTSGKRDLILLAPQTAWVPEQFTVTEYNPSLYESLLTDMQRMRGNVYLEDGAIRREELTPDGRHNSPVDRLSWHVLAVNQDGHVCGCARYLAHDTDARFSDLILSKSALAQHPQWRRPLIETVQSDLERARRRGIAYAEVGGWALDKAARSTSEALRIALATYALSRQLGGCIGVTTATVRHCSAAILQKIGGRVLDFAGFPLPYYYDPQYRCDMTMLRFESSQPNPRYESWIEGLRTQFRAVPVVCKNSVSAWQSLPMEVAVCA
jgi:hypothetical protein